MKKVLLSISLASILTGCQMIGSSIQATQEDALEVALDDSNVLENEVISHDITDSKGKYSISFSTSTGFYEYVIGHDGIIQKKEYTAGAQSAPAEETVESEVKEEKTELSEDQKTSAIKAACDYIGAHESEISDADVSLKDGEITVRFVYNNASTVTVLNANTNEILSHYTE